MYMSSNSSEQGQNLITKRKVIKLATQNAQRKTYRNFIIRKFPKTIRENRSNQVLNFLSYNLLLNQQLLVINYSFV